LIGSTLHIGDMVYIAVGGYYRIV